MGYVENLRSLIGNMPINLIASTVVVLNDVGEILLQRRNEPYGAWGLPGGILELGESAEDAGKREVLEETGLLIDDLHLIDVFSGNEYSHIKLKNGDEYYVVLVAYYTRKFTGELKADGSETIDCKFFNVNKLPKNVIVRHRQVLNKYLKLEKTCIK